MDLAGIRWKDFTSNKMIELVQAFKVPNITQRKGK